MICFRQRHYPPSLVGAEARKAGYSGLEVAKIEQTESYSVLLSQLVIFDYK